MNPNGGGEDLRALTLDDLALSEHLMPVFLDELSDSDLLPVAGGPFDAQYPQQKSFFDGFPGFDAEPARTTPQEPPQAPLHRADSRTVLPHALASPESLHSLFGAALQTDVEPKRSVGQKLGAEEKRRPPMQNSTRKRQKAELAYLRDKVQALEGELAARRRTLMAGSRGGNKETGCSAEGRTIAVKARRRRKGGDRKSLWERMAKHQLVEKQRAEMQNLKLRESLSDQLKLARSLQRLLKKPPSANIDDADTAALEGRLEFGGCSNNRLSCRGVSEPELYDALMSDLDKVYAEVDAVCARHRSMRGLDDDGYDAEPAQAHAGNTDVDSGPEPLFLEATTSKVIPFGMEETCAAVWRCLSSSHVKLADGFYHGMACSPDTIRAKSVMTLRVGNVRAQMRMRFAMKKFVERHRVVLTCESASDSEGPRDLLHGLKMMERGWVVIRPVPADYYSEEEEDGKPPCQHQETIIQLCMRLTPSLSASMLETSEQRTGALTELILTAVHRNLGWLFQTVENILMEQAMAASAS